MIMNFYICDEFKTIQHRFLYIGTYIKNLLVAIFSNIYVVVNLNTDVATSIMRCSVPVLTMLHYPRVPSYNISYVSFATANK